MSHLLRQGLQEADGQARAFQHHIEPGRIGRRGTATHYMSDGKHPIHTLGCLSL